MILKIKALNWSENFRLLISFSIRETDENTLELKWGIYPTDPISSLSSPFVLLRFPKQLTQNIISNNVSTICKKTCLECLYVCNIKILFSISEYGFKGQFT